MVRKRIPLYRLPRLTLRYLPTNAPHWPYHVDPAYSQPFKNKGLPDDQANFHGMIQNIDDNVGRLLKRLDDLQIASNTIVIFMTDNGTAVGDRANMRDQKGSEYEGGHRVPCFIRWPEAISPKAATCPW